MVPSRRPPISTCCTWARPWPRPSIVSDRVSSQRSGRSSRLRQPRDEQLVGRRPRLGAEPAHRRRGRSRGRRRRRAPRHATSAAFTACAFWLLDQNVSRPSSPHSRRHRAHLERARRHPLVDDALAHHHLAAVEQVVASWPNVEPKGDVGARRRERGRPRSARPPRGRPPPAAARSRRTPARPRPRPGSAPR